MVQLKKTVQAASNVAQTRQSMPFQGGMRVGARSVGTYVPRLTKAAFEKFGFSAVQLISEWPQIAGADLAKYTAPERIVWPRRAAPSGEDTARKGPAPAATLHLRVDPAKALDVQYGSALLIDRINAYFGYRAVGDVRLIQVAPARRATSPSHAGKPQRVAPQPEGVFGLADPALEAALQRMRAGLKGRKTS